MYLSVNDRYGRLIKVYVREAVLVPPMLRA